MRFIIKLLAMILAAILYMIDVACIAIGSACVLVSIPLAIRSSEPGLLFLVLVGFVGIAIGILANDAHTYLEERFGFYI